MAFSILMYPGNVHGLVGCFVAFSGGTAWIGCIARIGYLCLDRLLCLSARIDCVARLPGYTVLPDCLDRSHCPDRKRKSAQPCPDRSYCPDTRICPAIQDTWVCPDMARPALIHYSNPLTPYMSYGPECFKHARLSAHSACRGSVVHIPSTFRLF